MNFVEPPEETVSGSDPEDANPQDEPLDTMPIPDGAEVEVEAGLDPEPSQETLEQSRDTEGEPAVGLALSFNGDATILGSDGDDTLSANPEDAFDQGATLVELGAGDDIAEVNVFVDTVNGGPGDDRILFLHAELGNANGGDGDDTLSGIGDVALDGGAGNDVIITDFIDTGLNDNAARADGGDGDDMFVVTQDIASTWRNSVGGVIASGGEGEDVYELNFVYGSEPDFIQGPPQSFGPEDSLESSAGISIRDFDPAEDMLRIEVSVPEGESLPTLEGVDISVLDREGFALFTTVTISLNATETQPEVQTSFTLSGRVDISAEDIVFVNVSPAVA